MPSCEKCWADSRLDEMRGVECAYTKLVDARTARGQVCTPEEQAGPDATLCEHCNRMTRHQHCGVCMACSAPKESE